MTTIAQQEKAVAALENVAVVDVMHKGVFHCPPETPIKVVAKIMATNRIHSVVVFGDPGNYNDEKAWRIVSDVDLVALALSDPRILTAADAATGEILTVGPSDPIALAARVMAENRTSHLVVVDDQSQQPVGMLSTIDIASAIARPSTPAVRG